jgi:gamma-glutamylcyclotransferase (GGCT)/AIG2-like uncharacterized protein YtfP
MAIVFAYGCLMDPAVMRRVCPSARAAGAGRLEGHRLTFPIAADDAWAGAVASVEPARGHAVEGGRWSVDNAGLARLDAYEEVAAGVYRRETLGVTPMAVGEGRAVVRAYVYRATPATLPNAPARSTRPARPTPAYRDALLAGADHFGLTPAYRAALQALPVRSLTPPRPTH